MFQNLQNLKNINFPTRKHTFLQNRRSRAPSWRRTSNHENFKPKTFEKLQKIIEKTGLKTGCNSTLIFNDFCCHLASQIGLKFRIFFEFFRIFRKTGPTWPQERPKSAPRASQEWPRGSKTAPKSPQERPKSLPRMPKSAPRATKSTQRAQKHVKTRKNIHKHVKTHRNARKHTKTNENA